MILYLQITSIASCFPQKLRPLFNDNFYRNSIQEMYNHIHFNIILYLNIAIFANYLAHFDLIRSVYFASRNFRNEEPFIEWDYSFSYPTSEGVAIPFSSFLIWSCVLHPLYIVIQAFQTRKVLWLLLKATHPKQQQNLIK